MSALTTTTTFCPSSFQLKFALGGRKPPLAFARARVPDFDRRRVNFVSLVVRSSAVNGNGLERRSSGNSSWTSMSSSADGFSGWANADADRQSDDPKPKRSLAGILGAGAAAVVFVAGLTFVVLSMSNKSNSRVKKEMVAITTQQEESLSSDENPNQVEEEKNGENVGMLESSSEEAKTGTNEDPVNEATESRNSDDNGVSQSSEDGDGYIPKTAQEESSTGDNLVSLEAADKNPTSDFTSSALLSTEIDNGNIPSENNGEPEKFANTKILEPSVFVTDSEDLVTDSYPNGVSSLNELENSDLYFDPSMLDISVKSESDAATKSIISKDLFTEDVDPSELLEVFVDGDDKSLFGKNLNGTPSSEPPLVPEVAYQSGDDYNDINGSQSFFESANHVNAFTSAGIPAPSVVSAALQTPPGKVLVPAVVDQLQSQALFALQVLKGLYTWHMRHKLQLQLWIHYRYNSRS